jgi:hypothetical protein
MEEVKERYVSKRVAELLKIAGFAEEVRAYYQYDSETKQWDFELDDREDTPSLWGDYYLSAPTQQMAREWIETKYKLFIEVRCGCDLDDAYHWTGTAWFDYDIIPIGKEGIIIPDSDGIETWDKPWKAVDAALVYVLINIILSGETVEPDKDDFDKGFTNMMLKEL